MHIAVLAALAMTGVTAGCLTSLAPNIRARDHHQGISATDPDADCLVCHEPEMAAQARLMKMAQTERDAAMDRMMGGGGATLVAQWMIDEPRGCLQCHVMRGGGR